MKLNINWKCPVCGKVLDACTAVEPNTYPDEGDFTFCLYCGTPLRFGKHEFTVIQENEATEIEKENINYKKAREVVKEWRAKVLNTKNE